MKIPSCRPPAGKKRQCQANEWGARRPIKNVTIQFFGRVSLGTVLCAPLRSDWFQTPTANSLLSHSLVLSVVFAFGHALAALISRSCT